MPVYEDETIYVEIHESEIPWLKIFTQRTIREFSECSPEEKRAIWEALELIEREMLAVFRPEKINIAQFGNYLPHLHWHIMARFKEDSYFPEPMWGQKQRQGEYQLSGIEAFGERIAYLLKQLRP
jgi:diadenosine tetraphosphate (Ap4A) HIT family hydrolase